MSGHTQGRLKQRTGYPMDIVGPDENYAFARAMRVNTLDNAEANARRLVACWNWCEGQDTEGLELSVELGRTAKYFIREVHVSQLKLLAQHDELLIALRPLITKRMGAEQIREGIQRAIARAAIAKVEP